MWEAPSVADVFPDRSMDHAEKLAWMIETNGWAMEAVPLDPPRPAYAYTVGLEATYGFPEVVVFGLKPVHSRGLIGLLTEFLADGVDIPVGAVFQGLLDNGLRAALLPVDVAEHLDLFASLVAWHHGSDFHVVQLAWPDRSGWLPWETGFERRLLFAQPVVGATDTVE
jgi:hypothetical protein